MIHTFYIDTCIWVDFYENRQSRSTENLGEFAFAFFMNTDEQKAEAEKLATERGVPSGDALHAIIARDNCAVFITRDKHFQLLKDICESFLPEEL